MSKTGDFLIGMGIKLWLSLILIFCTVSARCSDVKELRAEEGRKPTSIECKSEKYVEEDGRSYWQTRGIRWFVDGSSNMGLIYRGEYHTQKQMQKIRKRALIECADWLSKQESRK